MSLLAVAAQVAPTVAPVVVTKTVVVAQSSHFFQLAQIVKYLGLGAGLSLIHAVVNNRFGLPKLVNKVLPLVYSVVVTLAILVVDGGVNWNDWYSVFVQVFAGSVAFYAVVTLVTPSPSKTVDELPVVATV